MSARVNTWLEPCAVPRLPRPRSFDSLPPLRRWKVDQTERIVLQAKAGDAVLICLGTNVGMDYIDEVVDVVLYEVVHAFLRTF